MVVLAFREREHGQEEAPSSWKIRTGNTTHRQAARVGRCFQPLYTLWFPMPTGGAFVEDARHYMSVLRHSWKVLLVTALIAGAAGIIVAFALPRTYESEARILVSEPDSGVNVYGSALPELAGQKDNAVQTQAELLRSRSLFQSVIDRLGLHDSVASLSRRVKITAVGQTSVLSITARSDSPQTAANIANELANEYLARYRDLKHASLMQASDAVAGEVAKAQSDLNGLESVAATAGLSTTDAAERQILTDRLASLSSTLEQLKVNQQVEQGWGILTDEAVAIPTPIGPTPVSSGALGVLAGLLFGIVYVVFQDARMPRDPALILQDATLLFPADVVAPGADKPAETPAAEDKSRKREKQLV